MRNNDVEILNFDDLLIDNIEVIDIDCNDIEIIEVSDDVSLDNLEVYDKKISSTFLSKVRERLNKKKFAIVSICCTTLLITLTGVFTLNNKLDSHLWKKQDSVVYSSLSDNVDFYLNDDNYNNVLVNGVYEEKGATVCIDGVFDNDNITIDSSHLDVTKVGTYHVIYNYVIGKNQVKTLYRTVNVVDNEAPTVSLLGSNIYMMLVNDSYVEAGLSISDNSKDDLSNNVVVENNVDSSKPGVYYIKYTVSDNSGNVSSIYRTVVVKYSYTNNTNTVISNSFTDNGLFIKGMVQNNNFQYKMLLKNKDNGSEKLFDVNKTSNHYYQFSFDVTDLENGNYEFYLVNDNLELLANNMNVNNRLVMAHIGDKLITMDYSKASVNMRVEDFHYLYDVVIDPGHGGSDTGATNGVYCEKNINLEQSLYEKQRFEQHGLKVMLLRDDNSDYGIMMGDNSLDDVERKGYAVGYYGVLSKIVYSNHHNSSGNSTSAGWEILVPASATYDDLIVEHKIADIWSNQYIRQVNPYYRFYTKDYENASVNNKMNGEVYSFKDYYAVIRIPLELYNVKNVIFEGAYINNNSDMHWYYDSLNWKMLSEVKIKSFVESIGVQYIEP